MPEQSTVKRVMLNAALILSGILAGILILEAGLRLTGFQPGNPYERLINNYEPDIGYYMVPGMQESIKGPDKPYHVEIISIGLDGAPGFRDDGIDGEIKSIFLGDSFVWGYGVELRDSVSEVYERISHSDAVNLGMSNWTSPIQYSRLLEKYGVALKPQYAFVGFFLGNDFGDTTNFTEWEESHTDLSYPVWLTNRKKGYSGTGLIYKTRRFLYDHMALYRFLTDRIKFSSEDEQLFDDIVYVKTDTLDLCLYWNQIPLHVPGLYSQIKLVRAALGHLIETAESNGIEPVIFIIPTKEMVYIDYFPGIGAKKTVDQRYTAILKILDDLGVRYLDLLPIFRRRAALGEQLYFKYDGHWNEAGHELAARSIWNFVRAQGPGE